MPLGGNRRASPGDRKTSAAPSPPFRPKALAAVRNRPAVVPFLSISWLALPGRARGPKSRSDHVGQNAGLREMVDLPASQTDLAGFDHPGKVLDGENRVATRKSAVGHHGFACLDDDRRCRVDVRNGQKESFDLVVASQKLD